MAQQTIRKSDVQHIKQACVTASKLSDNTVITHTFRFDGKEYIFKAHSNGNKAVRELYDCRLGSTVFHSTQAPYLYVDTTLHSTTKAILALLIVLNDLSQI